MPTLRDAFEDYMTANPNRSKRTDELYRYEANRYLGDWLSARSTPSSAETWRPASTGSPGITAAADPYQAAGQSCTA